MVDVMRRLLDSSLSLLIPCTILLYLVLAPYTKVEESFNIQATHDILTFGIPWGQAAGDKLRKQYDHLTFTGSVPRTFVGPLALAGGSWPLLWGLGGGGGVGRQVVVRAVLGLFNAYCMICFRDGVAKAFGRNAANWYAVFQASQFHMMYYASRTLPNFFAFGLVTLATSNLLPHAGRRPTSKSTLRRTTLALVLLTITGIIFRSEIAILLSTYTLYLYLRPHIALPLTTIIPAGFLGLLLGLLLTIPLDSFFWQRPYLWPELTGFIYNIIHSQSSNWGIQPYHFYFTSALPRLLFNPLIWQICLPFALSIPILRRPTLDILIPNIAFIAIYSFQPHKEWRFIIYVVPPILAVASAGASWIWTRRAKSFPYRVLSLVLVASTLASFAASGAMLAVSRLNYPGAEALNRLHALANETTGVVRVHMDTLACMTGVTRFLELPPPPVVVGKVGKGEERGAFWVYDKEEDERRLLDPLFWEGVDYAIAEFPERVIGRWEVLDTVEGYKGVEIMRPGEGVVGGEEEGGRERVGWEEVWESCSSPVGKAREGRGLGRLGDCVGKGYELVEGLLRRYVTRGWWVRMKMEPRLRILRKDRRRVVYDDAAADDVAGGDGGESGVEVELEGEVDL
ncbi:hypothetical protein JMJ35_001587 [Cladonia borealis]|uniref:Mannosyltransferase n=1 Tax=Cladonia borealis TaxID=184061 RepID=A0AA39R634_9LECA|nr:hypothetical protein JMJ35_001587 [Cladonia borealis]